MEDGSLHDRLRRLPAVDRVVDALSPETPRAARVGAARAALDAARARIRGGQPPPSLQEVVASAAEIVAAHDRIRLQPVINATGVLVHTNLGRVPLGSDQLDAVVRVASGYSNLEYDLTAGARGSRLAHTGRLLAALTGAEAGLVVNNNAAAVLLAIAGLGAGGDVIVSRGELVEIGGEFRIPDVVQIAGVRLVEVGTTNRTHLSDYENAITPQTRAILKVHPSNYRMIGFTAAVEAGALGRLARERHVAFINDLGSGLIEAPGEPAWAREEPRVSDAVAEGADVVTFSGDKLLGGPQAGVVVGRRRHVEALGRHALIRALRVDKMTLAALEATLDLYLRDRAAELPLWAAATRPAEEIRMRATSIAESIAPRLAVGFEVGVTETTAVTGGGSLPGVGIESFALALTHGVLSPAEIERRLRRTTPPVIGLVDEDRVLLDLRTVPEQDDEALADLVVSAFGTGT